MLQVVFCLLAAISALWLGGCQNPVRQSAPPVPAEQPQADWREELRPGRSVDRALAFLLTGGYECRVTRDEKARVERILATPNRPSPSGPKQPIDITIGADKIERVEMVPRAGR